MQIIQQLSSSETQAFTDKGILINSNEFDGLTHDDAFERIAETLEKKTLGK